MKWIRYTHAGNLAYGILEGDVIEPVRGDPFGGYERLGGSIALADVRIEVPVVPPTFYCVGLNYAKHAAEHGMKMPTQPDVGYRANNALTAHGTEVSMPSDAAKVQYEGELVVVIGKKARNLSPEEARSCVLGYTIGNDVSDRAWQASDRTFWRAKNADTFKPMGPWIETEANLDAMETVVRLNGEEQIRFGTNDMVFGVDRFISTMSQYLTLYPGDILWMGTEGSSPDLKHGDVVDISLTGLGTLSNRFVRED